MRVKVVDSEFGRAIADGKGEAFYLFRSDGNRRSECYGACAKVWPPVITKGKPRAGEGAEFGGLWLVVRPSGKAA